jgi:hypothetical protein
MKKLLTATAMTAVMASGAWSQDIPGVPGPSILERIIQDAENLSINMLNLSENYAEVSAETNLTLPAGLFDFLTTSVQIDGLFSSTGLITEFEPQVAGVEGSNVEALELKISFADPVEIINALKGTGEDGIATTIGDIATTAIGALNTGRIGQFDSGSDGILETTRSLSSSNVIDSTRVASLSNAYTSSTGAFNATFADSGLTNLSNLAGNYSGSLTSTNNINVAGLVSLGEVSTTAIGSLNTGDIAASVTGATMMNLSGAWCGAACAGSIQPSFDPIP